MYCFSGSWGSRSSGKCSLHLKNEQVNPRKHYCNHSKAERELVTPELLAVDALEKKKKKKKKKKNIYIYIYIYIYMKVYAKLSKTSLFSRIYQAKC